MIDLRELIQKISQAKDKLELQNIKSQFLAKLLENIISWFICLFIKLSLCHSIIYFYN